MHVRDTIDVWARKRSEAMESSKNETKKNNILSKLKDEKWNFKGFERRKYVPVTAFSTKITSIWNVYGVLNHKNESDRAHSFAVFERGRERERELSNRLVSLLYCPKTNFLFVFFLFVHFNDYNSLFQLKYNQFFSCFFFFPSFCLFIDMKCSTKC